MNLYSHSNLQQPPLPHNHARYDQVNRIVSAQTTATSGNTCFGETYSYDQWANLYTVGAVSGYTACTQDNLNLGVGSVTTKNQLSSTGFAYDLAGNMTGDNTYTYGYNAESEIKSAAGVNYTYDGDGNRLEKSSGKLYWYGAGTEILHESDLSGNFTNEYVFFGGKRIAMRTVSTGTIYYYEEDMLGSSRTMVQAGQTSVCFDADFLPFGYEKDVTTTCTQSYKFEGKERDTETNNDDFGARYYTFRLGRWLSADWSSVPAPVPFANVTNPQTLNLYAMVSDNPQSFADLNGHDQVDYSCMCAPIEKRGGHPKVAAAAMTLAAAGAAGVALWEAGAAAAGSTLFRNLLGLFLATAPRTVPIVAGAIEGLTPGAPGSLTISSATRLTEEEISTGVRLADQTGKALVQSAHQGAEYVDAAGKTYDAVNSPTAYANWGTGEKILANIKSTALKSVDYVVVDLKGASKEQIAAMKNYVKTLTQAQQKKIIYVK